MRDESVKQPRQQLASHVSSMLVSAVGALYSTPCMTLCLLIVAAVVSQGQSSTQKLLLAAISNPLQSLTTNAFFWRRLPLTLHFRSWEKQEALPSVSASFFVLWPPAVQVSQALSYPAELLQEWATIAVKKILVPSKEARQVK